MKACSRCRAVKPPTEFYRHRRAKDGLQSRCRKCHNVARTKRGYSGTAVCQVFTCDLPPLHTKRWCRAHAPSFLEPVEPAQPAAERRAAEVERLSRHGYSAKDIARELGVSERTVVRDRRRRGMRPLNTEMVTTWALGDEPPPLDADGMLWEVG